MSVFKINKRNIFISILVITISLLLVHTVSGIGPEPGSDEDPLVTKSYVDTEFGKFSAQVNSKINLLKSELRRSKSDETIESVKGQLVQLEKNIDNLKNQIEEQSKYMKFKVVELEAGQSIILGDSAEIILRAGKALAIAGEKGDGLSDITTDSKKNNLVTDDIVPLNHMLLISRDDGRGIRAVTKIWVLVKGDYKIEGDDIEGDSKADGEGEQKEGVLEDETDKADETDVVDKVNEAGKTDKIDETDETDEAN